ncbi:MAG: hypothetical protein M1812_005069 [Candelaria pacifica]|nr:MAG: hypothetical protein M1812_005069 [Candelaria pacifica]
MILFTLLILIIAFANANVEKIIFKGPESILIPLEHPNLDDLRIDRISPLHWSLRTQLSAEFPNDEAKKGKESWFLLDKLKHGQRYEVRVCWLATQPTSFRLYTHTLPTVFQTPNLITSLATFSESRQYPLEDQATSQHLTSETPSQSSILFLQIFAAADYYTMNQTLMKNVPPVDVDIILDPYIWNVFPRSLVPTAGYIALLAIGSWFVSGWIWEWLSKIATVDPEARLDVKTSTDVKKDS